jgi:Na+/glutamate symporter
MDNQSKVDNLANTLITTFAVITGAASSLDTVEQIGRILLLFISICSGILLIAVNWDKGISQFKKWIKKNG